MGSELLEMLKSGLVEEDTGTPIIHSIIRNFVLKQKEDPNSRAQIMIMDAIGLNPDLPNKLDKWLDNLQQKDLDLHRYSIVKLLHPAQRLVFDDPTRDQLWQHGRRWGKSHLAAAKLVFAAQYEKKKCAYLHRSFSTGLNQIWPYLMQIMDGAQITAQKLSASTGTIEFTGGGTIEIRGAYDKVAQESLRGFKYGLVVIDEFFFLKTQKYLIEDILKLQRAEVKDSQIIAVSSPPRQMDRYFETIRETWSYHTGDMRDNTFKPELKLEFERQQQTQNINGSTWKREWCGIWEPDTDAIVYKIAPYSGPLQGIDQLFGGIDYGYSDKNQVIIIGVNKKSRQQEVLYQDQWSHSTASYTLDRIKGQYEFAKSKENDLGIKHTFAFYQDTSDQQLTQELYYNMGVPQYNAYKHHKSLSIHKIQDMLQTGNLIVPDGDENNPLREDAFKVLWKRDETTDAIIDEIDDDLYHSDIYPALRYAMVQYFFSVGEKLDR